MKRLSAAATARLSLCMNLMCALYTGVLGVLGRSMWFVASASYYVILAVMRFAVLVMYGKESERNGVFITRFVGRMLVLLSVPLAFTVYLSLKTPQGCSYHIIVMITIATCTFAKLTAAAINMHKSRNKTNTLKCLRSLSLADAAVSVFSMQRSMLVTFEGMSAQNIKLMNAFTGTGVYLLVALGGFMLIGGKSAIMAKSKIVKANEAIAKTVTDCYKKVESGVVNGYTKVEDKFVERFLMRDSETVEEAKARLKNNSNNTL